MAGMPSTVIDALVQQQMAGAASSQAYANIISDTYGTRRTPPSQGAVSAGGGVQDPRTFLPLPPVLPSENILAMGAMQVGRSGVDLGLGAMSLMGAFGMAPRVFDPFSTTLKGMQAGWGYGGAAGAVGFGAAAMLPYLAGGAALNYGMGQVMTGAHDQLGLSNMLNATWSRANTPWMGLPDVSSQVQMGNAMAGMSGPFMSMGDLTGMMQTGLTGGTFRGAGNIQQLMSQFRAMKDEIAEVAQVYHTSLSEAQQLTSKIKGLGFYRTGQAGEFASQMRGLATAIGSSAEDMYSAGSAGANMWGGMGLSRATGARTMLGLTGRMTGLVNAGIISGDALRDAAGGAPIGEAIQAASNRLMGYGVQFAHSRYGQRVLGALMDPTTGELDPSLVSQFPMMGMQEINQLYNKHTAGDGRLLLKTRTTQMAGDLNAKLGPEWWGSTIGALTRTRGDGSGSQEEYLQAIFGQIPQQDMDMLRELSSMGPSLRANIAGKTREALAAGIQEAASARTQSWEGMKARVHEAILGPIERQMRTFGREVFGNIQGWVGDAIGDFLGSSSLPTISPAALESLAYTQVGLGGGRPGLQQLSQGVRRLPGTPTSGLERTVHDWMPQGVYDVIQGGSFGGLRGMTSESWNPYATAGWAAVGLPLFGGESAMGLAGRGVAAGGRALREWGGLRSLTGGVSRGAGWLATGAGKFLGGASKLLKGVGLVGLGADLAFNLGPEILQKAGIISNTANGIGGGSATLLNNLWKASGGDFDISGFGMYAGGGAIPIKGGPQEGGNQLGFISEDAAFSGLPKIHEALFNSSQALGDLSSEEAMTARAVSNAARQGTRDSGAGATEFNVGTAALRLLEQDPNNVYAQSLLKKVRTLGPAGILALGSMNDTGPTKATRDAARELGLATTPDPRALRAVAWKKLLGGSQGDAYYDKLARAPYSGLFEDILQGTSDQVIRRRIGDEETGYLPLGLKADEVLKDLPNILKRGAEAGKVWEGSALMSAYTQGQETSRLAKEWATKSGLLNYMDYAQIPEASAMLTDMVNYPTQATQDPGAANALFERFGSMDQASLRKLVGILGQDTSGGFEQVTALGQAYGQTRQRYGEYMLGRGKDIQKWAAKNPNAVLNRRQTERMFQATINDPQAWTSFKKILPHFTQGDFGMQEQIMMNNILKEAGLSDPNAVVNAVTTAYADGKVEAKETDSIMKAWTQSASISTTKTAAGAGSPDKKMEMFVTAVENATDRLNKLAVEP